MTTLLAFKLRQLTGAEILSHVRRMDPCGDPEFELHNHKDYARQSCFKKFILHPIFKASDWLRHGFVASNLFYSTLQSVTAQAID